MPASRFRFTWDKPLRLGNAIPNFAPQSVMISERITNVVQAKACGSCPKTRARTWLVGLNTRDCLSIPNSLASFGIKFRGINLKICDNTVILCFDGFMDAPCFFCWNISCIQNHHLSTFSFPMGWLWKHFFFQTGKSRIYIRFWRLSNGKRNKSDQRERLCRIVAWLTAGSDVSRTDLPTNSREDPAFCWRIVSKFCFRLGYSPSIGIFTSTQLK